MKTSFTLFFIFMPFLFSSNSIEEISKQCDMHMYKHESKIVLISDAMCVKDVNRLSEKIAGLLEEEFGIPLGIRPTPSKIEFFLKIRSEETFLWWYENKENAAKMIIKKGNKDTYFIAIIINQNHQPRFRK